MITECHYYIGIQACFDEWDVPVSIILFHCHDNLYTLLSNIAIKRKKNITRSEHFQNSFNVISTKINK